MTSDAPSQGPREIVHRILLFIFLLCAVSWVTLLRPNPPSVMPFLTALLLSLATASTLAGLARSQPIENVLMAGIFVAGTTALFQIVTAKSSARFGIPASAVYNLPPWPLPLFWAVIILNSRDVARLILRPFPKLTNPGYWTLALATFLAVATGFNFAPFADRISTLPPNAQAGWLTPRSATLSPQRGEGRGEGWADQRRNDQGQYADALPFASNSNRYHYWTWPAGLNASGWYGAPLANFLVLAVMALMALAFATPWLINKKPVKPPALDFHPLLLWMIANFLLIAANAVNHLWAAAGFGFFICLIVLTLALRDARWRRKI